MVSKYLRTDEKGDFITCKSEENLLSMKLLTNIDQLNACGRGSRERKATLDAYETTCPICAISMSESQLEQHITVEMQRLDDCLLNRQVKSYKDECLQFLKVNKINKSKRKLITKCHYENPPEDDKYHDVVGLLEEGKLSDDRFEDYKAMELRRKGRMLDQYKPIQQCPMCNMTFEGDNSQLIAHVDQCLRNNEDISEINEDEDEDVDIEGDSYQWVTGDWRIRASSLFENGQKASGKSKCATDENMDVDIEEDSEITSFGNTQYNENDIIFMNETSDNDENMLDSKKLRLAVRHAGTSRDADLKIKSENDEEEDEDEDDVEEVDTNSTLYNLNRGSMVGIITSLKSRVKQLEKQHKNPGEKCLICMEVYTKPVTSTICWHVHCENCWLQSMGTKKVCPQCNAITTAENLRRIYL